MCTGGTPGIRRTGPHFRLNAHFGIRAFLPVECSVNPERVMELPYPKALNDDLQMRIWEWDIGDVLTEIRGLDSALDFYGVALSTCPGTKIGGHPHWIQHPEVPSCQAGHEMSFLLALADGEFDANSILRWCPVDDRALIKDPYREKEIRAAAFPSLNGLQNIFVCRQCPDWPIKSTYQR